MGRNGLVQQARGGLVPRFANSAPNVDIHGHCRWRFSHRLMAININRDGHTHIHIILLLDGTKWPLFLDFFLESLSGEKSDKLKSQTVAVLPKDKQWGRDQIQN